MVKTEAGSLPEGKVKIKLEHDGTILDVDEDDVEKVNGKWLQMVNSSAPIGSAAPIHTVYPYQVNTFIAFANFYQYVFIFTSGHYE